MNPCIHYLIAIAALYNAITHIELFPQGATANRQNVIRAIQEQISLLEKEYRTCSEKGA